MIMMLHCLVSGIELFSKGLGDLYYPSNDMDPYLKDGDVRMRTSILCVLDL